MAKKSKKQEKEQIGQPLFETQNSVTHSFSGENANIEHNIKKEALGRNTKR